MTTHAPTKTTTFASPQLQRKILKTIARKTFCTIATTSPAGRSHSAGVVYESVDGTLWVHSLRTSRKVRSIAANPHVGVCIPYRRLPVGPPFTIHFQATAEIVEMDDPEVLQLLGQGRLKAISGHGALDLPEGCFIAIRPHGNIHSYGPGARTVELIRDPLNSGASSFRFEEEGAR
ncbi:MAG: pyridoxamine 5'-phosphate oxidase family protein [Acidimicrobiales bacterium]